MPETTQAVHVENLSKRFDDVLAVDRITFDVERGELFGLLGPNGAGKTTTINMLTSLARPDTGTIQIGGINCSDRWRGAQRLVGVVPDESNLYPELTGYENLCFCAALYGLAKPVRQQRARHLLKTFGLESAAERKFAGYSKGMKRKLTIAAGIIHEPEILFLDEPTTGIDVASARQIRQLIGDLHRGGTTILLTTHYIEEAERLCGRIAFMVSGRIVRLDTVAQLLEPVQGRQAMEITCAKMPENMGDRLSAEFPHMRFDARSKDAIHVETENVIPAGVLVRFIEEHGGEVTEARRLRPSLEDVFVEITGIEAGAMRREKEKSGGPQ